MTIFKGTPRMHKVFKDYSKNDRKDQQILFRSDSEKCSKDATTISKNCFTSHAFSAISFLAYSKNPTPVPI